MSWRLSNSPPERTGTTLIELVIAVAMLALIAGVCFSVYHTASITLQKQADWRNRAQTAGAAMELARRDLACALTLGSSPESGLTLDRESGEHSSSTLRFYTAIADPDAIPELRTKVKKVVYGIQPAVSGEGTAYALMRETSDVTVSGDTTALPGETTAVPLVETLLPGVDEFTVEVFDGSAWKAQWPVSTGSDLPRAARMRIVFKEGSQTQTVETQTFIAAGNPLKPVKRR